jgi:uncharacterized membrane protein YiaA
MHTHYKTFWTTTAITLLCGILLHIFSYTADNYSDVPSVDTHSKYMFGFFSTYYWSLCYITIVPVGLGAAVCAHSHLTDLGLSWASKTRVISLWTGVSLAIAVVSCDVYRVTTRPAREWSQWNHVYEFQPASSWETHVSRVSLLVLAYGMYGTGYAIFASLVTATVLFLARNTTIEDIAESEERTQIYVRFCGLQRICIVVLMVYFVVLRVTKIEMYFVSSKSAAPAMNPMK